MPTTFLREVIASFAVKEVVCIPDQEAAAVVHEAETSYYQRATDRQAGCKSTQSEAVHSRWAANEPLSLCSAPRIDLGVVILLHRKLTCALRVELAELRHLALHPWLLRLRSASIPIAAS